jgi:hypothetical protein
MTLDTTDRTLLALFSLSRETLPIDAAALGAETGQSPTQAARALVALERAGFVDASRARLTMLGLARAAQLSARSGQGQRGAGLLKPLRAAESVPRIKPPVAARPRAAELASGAGDRHGRQEPLLEQIASAGIGQ